LRPRLEDNDARRRRGDANAHVHTGFGKIRQRHCEQKGSAERKHSKKLLRCRRFSVVKICEKSDQTGRDIDSEVS
jgi:hypothetical protein